VETVVSRARSIGFVSETWFEKREPVVGDARVRVECLGADRCSLA
jgi:hypothetical protein